MSFEPGQFQPPAPRASQQFQTPEPHVSFSMYAPSHLTATPHSPLLPHPFSAPTLPPHCHSHSPPATPILYLTAPALPLPTCHTHSATPTSLVDPYYGTPLSFLPTPISYLTAPIFLSQVTEHPVADHCSPNISVLLAELGSMINSPLLSDLTILTAQGTHISAHGCILAARCPGFREAVLEQKKPPQVLDLSHFSHKAVLAYLKCVYCASSSSHLDRKTMEQVEAISTK